MKTISNYQIYSAAYNDIFARWSAEKDKHDESVKRGRPNEITRRRLEKYSKQLDELHDAMIQLEDEMRTNSISSTNSTPTLEYIETRTMDPDSLRSLCCRECWYTRGASHDYSQLFNRLHDEKNNLKHLSTSGLAEIAKDIADHSNLPDDYDITCVMSELVRVCSVTFNIAN